ncbi:hypothetical protein J6590_100883, partial [Homalodisca vitripennis]
YGFCLKPEGSSIDLSSNSTSSYVQHLNSDSVADFTPEIWSHEKQTGEDRRRSKLTPSPTVHSFNMRDTKTTNGS